MFPRNYALVHWLPLCPPECTLDLFVHIVKSFATVSQNTNVNFAHSSTWPTEMWWIKESPERRPVYFLSKKVSWYCFMHSRKISIIKKHKYSPNYRIQRGRWEPWRLLFSLNPAGGSTDSLPGCKKEKEVAALQGQQRIFLLGDRHGQWLY